MTRNKMIEEVYNSNAFDECIKKMNPRHLQEDLRMEVMMVLLELPEEKMHESGMLLPYTIRIIGNMAVGGWNGFHKTYRDGRIIDIEFCQKVGQQSKSSMFHHSKINVEQYEDICMDGIDSNVDLCPSVKAVLNGRVVREQREDKVVEIVNGLRWHDREILKLYATLGSYRKVEKDTGIPWESVYKIVQRVSKKIIQYARL
jgi:hypothetical protein